MTVAALIELLKREDPDNNVRFYDADEEKFHQIVFVETNQLPQDIGNGCYTTILY